MAQRLYREWFVHFRYPGPESVPLVESELDPTPEGWQPESLGEVAEVNKDSISPNSAPETIVYLDISSVGTGVIEKLELMRFGDAPSRARRRIRHGDIIWSTVRPNRKSYALVLDPPEKTVVSTGFAVLRSTSIPFEYLYQAVTTDQFVDYLVNRARGAAYPAVNGSDFESALVLIPKRLKLDAYSDIAAPLLQLAGTLRVENDRLRQMQQLLLPQLIELPDKTNRRVIDGFSMNAEELLQLVAQGESETLEFKRTTGQKREAARTLCAMLNGNVPGSWSSEWTTTAGSPARMSLRARARIWQTSFDSSNHSRARCEGGRCR